MTNAKATYMFTAKIADNSGNTYITFFSELGEAIMNGKTAA